MQIKQYAKTFMILALSIVYMLGFTQFGASAFEKIFPQEFTFSEGTKIGEVDVSSMTKDEAEKRIYDQSEKWAKSTHISLRLEGDEEVNLDLSIFRILIAESVDRAKNGQTNPLIVTLEDKQLNQIISAKLGKTMSENINIERLKTDLISIAESFKTGTIQIRINDYLKLVKENGDEVVSEAILTNIKGNGNELTSILEQVNQIIIPANSKFSLLQFVKEKQLDYVTNESLSIIASAIYKTILPTNFEINVRNIGRTKPLYIDLGYEAMIEQDDFDLVFTNPNPTDYTIYLNKNGHTLKASLTGAPFVYKYEVQLENMKTIKPKKIVQYSSKIPIGSSQIINEGSNGYLVDVVRVTMNEDEVVLNTTKISEDYYPPTYQIELKNKLTKDSTDEINELEKDENIKENEENVADEEKKNQSDEIWEKPSGPVK